MSRLRIVSHCWRTAHSITLLHVKVVGVFIFFAPHSNGQRCAKSALANVHMATPEPGVDGLRLPPIGAPRIRPVPRTLADVLLLSPGSGQQPSRAAAISPGPLRGGATYSTGSRPGTVEGASVRLGGPRAGVSALTAAHNARTLDPLKIALDGDKKPRQRQVEPRGATTYITQHDDGGGEDGSSPVVSLLAGPGDDDVLRTPGAGV